MMIHRFRNILSNTLKFYNMSQTFAFILELFILSILWFVVFWWKKHTSNSSTLYCIITLMFCCVMEWETRNKMFGLMFLYKINLSKTLFEALILNQKFNFKSIFTFFRRTINIKYTLVITYFTQNKTCLIWQIWY